MQTSFTNHRGECPISDNLICPDYCEGLQVCANLERGRCFYAEPQTVFTATGGSGVDTDDSVQRDLYCFTFRLQNCTQDDMKLSSVRFNLSDRLFVLQTSANPANEIPFDNFQPDPNDNDVSGTGDVRVLFLESTCGTANFDNYNPFDEDNDNLLVGTTILPPGECCIKVLVAATYQFDSSSGNALIRDFTDTLIERSCLNVCGFQNTGASCSCRFKRSLLLPADCSLRLGRNTQA